jgi:hypothetical protein
MALDNHMGRLVPACGVSPQERVLEHPCWEVLASMRIRPATDRLRRDPDADLNPLDVEGPACMSAQSQRDQEWRDTGASVDDEDTQQRDVWQS